MEEIDIKNFDDWVEYTGASEGSGRSKKVWLISEEGKIGLFKFNKSPTTYENISEFIATKVANIIGIKSAYIELGTYNGKSGCMSYNILSKNEELLEGINLINRKYPNYDPEKLFDSKKKEYYSLEMILNSIEDYVGLEQEFIKIVFLDFLIGNTDRHQSNWGVLQKDGKINGIAPIYDNGSSLCSYIPESKIIDYLERDKLKFKSLVDTKSRSRIRVDKYNKKEPTHLEVIKYIKENNIQFNENAEIINKKINQYIIKELLNNIKEISENRKILIEKFILEKKEQLNKILKEGGKDVF